MYTNMFTLSFVMVDHIWILYCTCFVRLEWAHTPPLSLCRDTCTRFISLNVWTQIPQYHSCHAGYCHCSFFCNVSFTLPFFITITFVHIILHCIRTSHHYVHWTPQPQTPTCFVRITPRSKSSIPSICKSYISCLSPYRYVPVDTAFSHMVHLHNYLLSSVQHLAFNTPNKGFAPSRDIIH